MCQIKNIKFISIIILITCLKISFAQENPKNNINIIITQIRNNIGLEEDIDIPTLKSKILEASNSYYQTNEGVYKYIYSHKIGLECFGTILYQGKKYLFCYESGLLRLTDINKDEIIYLVPNKPTKGETETGLKLLKKFKK